MIVRAVTGADRSAWDALYDAYAQFYGVAQTPDMRATVWGWLSDPAHSTNGLVADRAGTLVGIAHYRAFARRWRRRLGCIWMICLFTLID